MSVNGISRQTHLFFSDAFDKLDINIGNATTDTENEQKTPLNSSVVAKYGDKITLSLNPEKIHVFDKETELTITN